MSVSVELRPAFQAQFHARWNHLNDPHVRALAWLLVAPDLLDPTAPEWQGRIASLPPLNDDTAHWLAALDTDPVELLASLDIQPLTRLGRYAENLMAFYLRHLGVLVAHGVQVRASKSDTVGEFDFLVREDQELVHWEFATKLYLLEASDGCHADYFVGPNLADTLGAKVRKIMERQLSLSKHPAARLCVPEPISHAQALVKGWLFYHGKTPCRVEPTGVSSAHCRGFWCELQEFESVECEDFIVLPRLGWLAPAKVLPDQSIDRKALHAAAQTHFATSSTPVLVALLERHGEWLLEFDRGFIAPDDWRSKAASRVRKIPPP